MFPASICFLKSRKLKDLRTCFRFFWQKKCFSRKKYVFYDFEAFLWHFDFTTIIDNFSTFFRRYVQPQKYFKKVETSGFTRLFSSFLGKTCVFRGKKYVFEDFEALLWHFDLRQLLTVFLFFSVDISSPENISKKSKL
jgi:hypothetical protein